MAFNYCNTASQQTLENLMPIYDHTFGNGLAIQTNSGNLMNYISPMSKNHLKQNCNNNNNHNHNNKHHKNIIGHQQHPSRSASCLPGILSNFKPLNNDTANKGTAPMDLVSDLENEQHQHMTNCIPNKSNTNNVKNPNNISTLEEKNAVMNAHNANIYMNGLMAGNMTPMSAGFMLYPTAAATTTAGNAAATASANALIHPHMVTDVMQRLHPNYNGYSMANDNADDLSLMNITSKTILADNASGTMGNPAKAIIRMQNCILLPPNPKVPSPTVRERPSGCRTVFVGGLPENITEEILYEIFLKCGEITTLRLMLKKNFCHIRYRSEKSVDLAICFSGYRIRIGNNNGPANYGRLHVDYAQARNDQYEHECKQRQLQREQRHREHKTNERSRSSSPSAVPHYSEHEAAIVADNLRKENTFVKALQTIAIWLERGDCSKRNSNTFYSMIQSTHAHVRRITGEKKQLESNLNKARESYRKQMLCMSLQFIQIEKVFNAASHKKVWDHFTKAQRKNIDKWKKLTTGIHSVQIENDEMEISDEECCSEQTPIGAQLTKGRLSDSEQFKEKNDALRSNHLEFVVGSEITDEQTAQQQSGDFREKEIKVLQETIRNLQTQLLQMKIREEKDRKTIEQLNRRLKLSAAHQMLLKTKLRQQGSQLTEHLNDCEQDSVEVISKRASKEIRADESDQFSSPLEVEVINIDVDKSDNDEKIIDILNEDEAPSTVKDNLTNHNGDNVSQPKHQDESKSMENTIALETIKPNSPDEAKLIALATAYLLVHPNGSTSDTIYSYIKEQTNYQNLQAIDLNNVLEKYGNLFQLETITTLNNSDTIKTNTTTTTTTNTTNTTTTSNLSTLKIWKFSAFTKQS